MLSSYRGRENFDPEYHSFGEHQVTALLPRLNLFADQGATFSNNVVATANGTPWNLTGFSAAGNIKKTYLDDDYIALSISISDPTSGVLNLSLDALTTSEADPGRYLYDVIITSPTGVATKLVEGLFVLSPSTSGI